jgi:hypothetical protein
MLPLDTVAKAEDENSSLQTMSQIGPSKRAVALRVPGFSQLAARVKTVCSMEMNWEGQE